ncbi:MAG: hypothetical protein AAF436_09620 [Myxococcota bacterium]
MKFRPDPEHEIPTHGFSRGDELLESPVTHLSWAERWAPDEAAAWARWRDTLSSAQRTEALLPLQAALTGLVAYRQLENHPLSATVSDFRPHLHTVCVTFDWALALVAELRPNLQPHHEAGDGGTPSPPGEALDTLERTLTDGGRVGRRLLELAVVDAGAFQASCDLFLRDLDRNPFFRPPAPLEFANVRELVHAESLTPALENWKTDAAKMSTTVAFLTLVRAHRFLGIAEHQLDHGEGLYRAQVVIAAVRRELRAFTRFLMVQGIETLANEFEHRLVSLDAQHVTGTYRKIRETSDELGQMRESAEALAIGVHAKARTVLDLPIGELDEAQDAALARARMRDAIAEVREATKGAARRLRHITKPAPEEPEGTEREDRLFRDVWAFRFVVRAFVAKGHAALDAGVLGGNYVFANEFAKHYRVFAQRLLPGTEYGRRGPLSSAISQLASEASVSPRDLRVAVRESEIFLAHLDAVFEELEDERGAEPFDREAAAADLRAYLAASNRPKVSGKFVLGVFGEGRSGDETG